MSLVNNDSADLYKKLQVLAEQIMCQGVVRLQESSRPRQWDSGIGGFQIEDFRLEI
jgi:hypothetical protein